MATSYQKTRTTVSDRLLSTHGAINQCALTLAASLALATPTRSAEQRFGFDACLKNATKDAGEKGFTCVVLTIADAAGRKTLEACETGRAVYRKQKALTVGPCRPIEEDKP